jgi:hypothetical protein
MLKTLVWIAVSPFIAVAMFCLGLLAAAAHLIALPALYVWERHRERKPITRATEKLRNDDARGDTTS